MSFFQIYLQAFLVIMLIMTVLWIVSIIIRNVSIVDLFWGFGFVVAGGYLLSEYSGQRIKEDHSFVNGDYLGPSPFSLPFMA